MKELHHTIVIGAGQAGLATSWHLIRHGIEHVVLERGRIGEAWRSHRWDSFRLLLPNRVCQLPGFGYTGDDPDGFMSKEDVTRFFDAYAASFDPPVCEEVDVTELRRGLDRQWQILTADGGVLGSDNVVVATGAHQRAHVPGLAARLDSSVAQVHSDQYRNPAQLPRGAVVVIGGGSSGGQIASELLRSGRRVYLALGRCEWLPRRYRGRDLTAWHEATGFSAQPVQSLPNLAARLGCLPMLAASDTGEDLTPYTLLEEGVVLTGRLTGVDGTRLRFADDLAVTLAAGNAFFESIKTRIDAYIERGGIDAPLACRTPVLMPDAAPVASIHELDLQSAGVSSVIWATGYRMDFGWISDAEFDAQGYPLHEGGVTPEAGLYFVGLPWLTTRGSGFIPGVGEDAERIVGHIRARTWLAAAVGSAPAREPKASRGRG
jgi:putative flavoprotein involved in K+ transport